MTNSISNAIKPLSNLIVNLREDYKNTLFTVLNHNQNSNSSKSLALYEYTQVIELLALGLLTNPKGVAIGILAGTIPLFRMKSIRNLVFYFNSFKKTHSIAKQKLNEIKQPYYHNANYNLESYKNGFGTNLVQTKKSMMDIRSATRITPILEEFVFRIVIQKSTEWIANKVLKQILPKDETTKYGFTFGPEGIKCKGYNINVPKIIAIFISSVTFALAHYHKSTEARLNLIPGAVVYGILADRYGILSSVSAHVMNNSILGIIGTHSSGVGNLIRQIPKNPPLEKQEAWSNVANTVIKLCELLYE